MNFFVVVVFLVVAAAVWFNCVAPGLLLLFVLVAVVGGAPCSVFGVAWFLGITLGTRVGS